MFKRVMILFFILASVCSAKEPPRPRPVHLDRAGERWALKTLRRMTLEQKVGQLIMVWVRVEFMNWESPEFNRLRDAVKRYHVGGFGVSVPADGPFLYRSGPYEAAMILNQLQRESDLPLIFAADFERGLSMRFTGATAFPHAMAFGATGNKDYAFAFGQITAQEARAIGVHWNFFPVADVNSVPANPIINTRSFGEDPKQVTDFVTAYIAGARGAGMLTTVKHFPGHGDTVTDSHLSVARVDASRQHLESVELPPFRAAINAGVDSVMVAHVTVPALEPDPNRVATISGNVISGLLKRELGFRGLVVTDAMDMAAITRLFPAPTPADGAARAAVAAFKAGNDLVLIPPDLDGAYRGLLTAARSGEIPLSRIDESVLKLLKAKASVGLHQSQLTDIEAIGSELTRPENSALAQHIADDAVTLVRDSGQVLPLKIVGTVAPRAAYQTVEEVRGRVVVVVFTDDSRTDQGRALERQIRSRVPDANMFYIDPRNAAALAPAVEAAVKQANSVIAAVYTTPSAGRLARVNGQLRGSVSLSDTSAALLRQVLSVAAPKTVVVALGNPYLAGEFPEVQTYVCTYSNSPVSETSAVKALFGEVPIHGRLPVTIPGIANRGAGIDRAAATK